MHNTWGENSLSLKIVTVIGAVISRLIEATYFDLGHKLQIVLCRNSLALRFSKSWMAIELLSGMDIEYFSDFKH